MIPNIDPSRPSTPLPAGGEDGAQPGGQISAPAFRRSSTPMAGFRDALPSEPRSLYMATLEEALWTGGPKAIEQALDHAGRSNRLGDPAFRKLVLDTLAKRTDARAFACLQQAAVQLKASPAHLFEAALRLGNRELIHGLSRAYPEAITADGWRWLARHAHDLGRSLLQSRPELEAGVPFEKESLSLFLPPSGADKPAAAHDRHARQAVVLQAMQRFPRHADNIVQHAAGGNMREAWAWALENPRVPRSEAFWEAALQRVPGLVRASIDSRPDAINGALILKAANLAMNDILEAACKARHWAMHEAISMDVTPARIVADAPEYAEQFEIMRRYGADPNFIPPRPRARNTHFAP